MPANITHIIEKASESFDLPLEVAAGLPRVEIRGGHQVTLESHSGIKEYGENQIVIDTPSGKVKITGAGLTIKSMNDQRIVINGQISSFEYI